MGSVHEGRVGEIEKTARMEYEKALSHLGALREGKLVMVRRVGAYRYYRACDVPSINRILASIDKMLLSDKATSESSRQDHVERCTVWK